MGAGHLRELRKWWDILSEMGPSLGYYQNTTKCWLVSKQGKEDITREVFLDTEINGSMQGQMHLGTVLHSRTYLEKYMNGKVEGWVIQVVKIAQFAVTYPQALYAAFTFWLRHCWNYYLTQYWRSSRAAREYHKPCPYSCYQKAHLHAS